MNVDVLIDCANVLGESPLWCERRQRLFWVDIRAPALYACDADGGHLRSWPMTELIGSFTLRATDDLVVALKSGLYDFVLASGALSTIARPERDRPQHRFNEGKCDPRGRFFAGTMNDVVREPTGVLYRLDADRSLRPMRSGIAVPNSLAFDGERKRMYFADTETRTICAFDYDLDDGVFGNERVFADLRGGVGRPDGSTVDADGCLWNAEVVSGRIVRYAPDGRTLATCALPVSRVTSLTFGGADLRTLYITTSSYRLTPAQLASEPHAGALFALRTPVPGLPAARFAG